MKKWTKLLKRSFTLFMALVLCLGMIQTSSIAASATEPTTTPELTETPTTTEMTTGKTTPGESKPAEVPTEVPAATEVPESTEIPKSTETPAATEAPEETETPEATETPIPSETPDQSAGDGSEDDGGLEEDEAVKAFLAAVKELEGLDDENLLGGGIEEAEILYEKLSPEMQELDSVKESYKKLLAMKEALETEDSEKETPEKAADFLDAIEKLQLAESPEDLRDIIGTIKELYGELDLELQGQDEIKEYYDQIIDLEKFLDATEALYDAEEVEEIVTATEKALVLYEKLAAQMQELPIVQAYYESLVELGIMLLESVDDTGLKVVAETDATIVYVKESGQSGDSDTEGKGTEEADALKEKILGLEKYLDTSKVVAKPEKASVKEEVLDEEQSSDETEKLETKEIDTENKDDLEIDFGAESLFAVQGKAVMAAQVQSGEAQASGAEGTKDNPYGSLAKAVSAINGREEKDFRIVLLSDLTATECARINGKNVTIDGQGYTITRGDGFKEISDTYRSWYNPAMIEVCNSGSSATATLTLENIILDDAEKAVGSIYQQAMGGDDFDHLSIVQDAIIATYDGVGTITLDSGATLNGYGGMSAVRLSGGTLVMESGSKITGSKTFTTRGGGTGPAGAVWIQGGNFTMEEGASIEGVTGRAVYVDSGSATINGIISNVELNSNMWNGSDKPNEPVGEGAHVRNGGQVTLNGMVDGAGKAVTAFSVTGSGTLLTMNKGAVIKDMLKAISAGSMAEVVVNGEITGLIGGGNAVNMNSGTKCTIGSDAEIHHNSTWRSTVYCQSGELHIHGWFHHNYNATDRSGAIEINNNGSGSIATLYEDARITNNYAYETGGGIMVTNGLLIMEGGEISGNVAGTFGGGISVRKGGQFIMKGGRITGNASAQNGAGVSYEGSDWSGKNAYIHLEGGEISGNKMNAQVTLDKENYTGSFTGGTDNDLAISTSDGPGTINRYFEIDSGVIASRNIYMAVDKKTVTVTDGTKLGNAGNNDIAELKKQGKNWGFAEPVATLWAQKNDSTSVTVSGIDSKLDSKKPVWVLARNNDTNAITRIPATLKSGVVSFQAPASVNGCALAIVQPAKGDVYVNLTSEVVKVLGNDIPDVIPYQVSYGLEENSTSDVLEGATEVKVTFLFQSGEEKVITAIKSNKASLAYEFGENKFKSGESIIVGAVLTFKNNNQDYTFYSGQVSIPMVEVHTVTFDSNGGSLVEAQEVEEGETVSRPANPTRTGYTFNGWMLNGTEYDFSTPVTSDITLTAQWRANGVSPTNSPSPSSQPTSGPAGPDDGDESTTPGTGTTAAAAPALEPPVILTAPVAAAPALVLPAAPAPAVVAAPEEPEQLTAVEDEEVPLADGEDPEPTEVPLEIMDEEEVPLATANIGSWSLVNLLSMLITAAVGIWMTINMFKKKEEEEDVERYEDEEERKRRRLGRIIGLIPMLVSILLFFFTENLKAPMGFVNHMTPLMLVFAVIQVVLLVVTGYNHNNNKQNA